MQSSQYMQWMDWVIVAIPVLIVIWVGIKGQKYVKGVSDFLTAGRVAGRYVISVASAEAATGLVTLVAIFEKYYKSGFAYNFWHSLITPVILFLSLTGYCYYRYRETRAMTLGQLLEIRYSRSFRLFAGVLQFISGIVNYGLFPAVGARFIVYYCNLPVNLEFYGWVCPTFVVIMAIFLGFATIIATMGGQITIMVTDCIQGLLSYPMYAVIVAFIVFKYSWDGDMAPVIMGRPKGHSMINPFDITELRDFNLFFVLVGVISSILNRLSWSGTQGYRGAAKNAHEQKISGILGTWRHGFNTMMMVLLALVAYMYLNSDHFKSGPAGSDACRVELATKAVEDVIGPRNPQVRDELLMYIKTGVKTPQIKTWIAKAKELDAEDAIRRKKLKYESQGQAAGVEEISTASSAKPGSQNEEIMLTVRDAIKGAQAGPSQTFRTLYEQMRVPMALRYLLPVGIMGVFCALCIFLMISTDTTYMHSWGSILIQDIVLPIRGKPFTPKQQLLLLRLAIACVAVFAFFFSWFFGQVDYIIMFFTITGAIWMGGAGPCIVGGLYWKRGTTAAAWTALITGSSIAIGGILVQSYWCDSIYPWLFRHDMVAPLARLLEMLSGPFEPIVKWRMNSAKFPINSQEIYFIGMMLSVSLYVIVSLLTCRQPFNMERMLHRGKYHLEGVKLEKMSWSLGNIIKRMVGIDSQYTRGDKILAWSVFIYSFVWGFGFCFVTVAIWNVFFHKWSDEWWSMWFFIQNFIIAGCVAVISTVWFSIGGTIDLWRLFRDLDKKRISVLDDGRVIDNVSADDVELVEKLDDVKIPEAHKEETILREELTDEGDAEDIKNLDEHTKTKS